MTLTMRVDDLTYEVMMTLPMRGDDLTCEER